MNYCGIVSSTRLKLHSKKTISEIIKWIEGWLNDLRYTITSKADDRAAYRKETTGAAINFPT